MAKQEYIRLDLKEPPPNGARCKVLTRDEEGKEIEVTAYWDEKRGAFAKQRTNAKRKGERVRGSFYQLLDTPKAGAKSKDK